jgi:hypothetical protein
MEVAMIKRPVAIGLTLCEQVIVEAKTGNITLVNCFTRLKMPDFPSKAQRMAAFAVLADGQGTGKFDLIVERLDTRDEVYEQSHQVTFADSLQEVNLFFRIHQCWFPAPGRYQALLLADGELIAQRVLEVIAKEEQT